MPMYDVKCVKCGKLHKDVFASAPTSFIIQKCTCGSKEFKKIPSAPNVRFEGDGWATKKKSPED